MMERIARSTALEVKQVPKSQFDKPYLSDNYQEMEHYQPFTFPFMRPPNFYYPPIDGLEPDPDYPEDWLGGGGSSCAITCLGNGGRRECDVPIRCRLGFDSPDATPGNWKIYKSQDQSPLRIERISINENQHYNVEIYPEDNTWDGIITPEDYLNVTVEYTKPDIPCKDEVQMFCKSCLCPSGTFADGGSNPSTISPGSSPTITIQGGCPPYSWSVSGYLGYTLNVPITTSLSNTVTSASGACGVDYGAYVKVTVTDNCNDSVEILLLNTGGQWRYDHQAQICVSWVCGSCYIDPSTGHTICYEDIYKIDTAWGSGPDVPGDGCYKCSDSGQDRCGNSHSDWIACEDWYYWGCPP